MVFRLPSREGDLPWPPTVKSQPIIPQRPNRPRLLGRSAAVIGPPACRHEPSRPISTRSSSGTVSSQDEATCRRCPKSDEPNSGSSSPTSPPAGGRRPRLTAFAASSSSSSGLLRRKRSAVNPRAGPRPKSRTTARPRVAEVTEQPWGRGCHAGVSLSVRWRRTYAPGSAPAGWPRATEMSAAAEVTVGPTRMASSKGNLNAGADTLIPPITRPR
jgi:hypothetical protein